MAIIINTGSDSDKSWKLLNGKCTITNDTTHTFSITFPDTSDSDSINSFTAKRSIRFNISNSYIRHITSSDSTNKPTVTITVDGSLPSPISVVEVGVVETLSQLPSDLVVKDSNNILHYNIVGNVTGNLTGNVTGNVDGCAKTLAKSGSTSTPMTFNWDGQSGQPSWLWGGNDGTNMYVYNPSNFSVNKATYDSNGNDIASTYLPKSGGTMTGRLTTASGTQLVLGPENNQYEGGQIEFGTPNGNVWSNLHMDYFQGNFRVWNDKMHFLNFNADTGSFQSNGSEVVTSNNINNYVSNTISSYSKSDPSYILFSNGFKIVIGTRTCTVVKTSVFYRRNVGGGGGRDNGGSDYETGYTVTETTTAPSVQLPFTFSGLKIVNNGTISGSVLNAINSTQTYDSDSSVNGTTTYTSTYDAYGY